MDVVCLSDPARAIELLEPYLSADVVRTNVIATSLHRRVVDRQPGRFWVVIDRQAVVGAAVLSPLDGVALLSADSDSDSDSVVLPLIEAIHRERPRLARLQAAAAVAAAAAGRWTELAHCGASPVESLRLYRLEAYVAPRRPVGGRLRRAGPRDVDLLVEWHTGFCADTAMPLAPNPELYIQRRIDDGSLWLWEDAGEPVSMAATTPVRYRSSRIGHVYTPASLRGRGYGEAVTAGATRELLGDGVEHCLLFTQLDNAGSNGIYRRLGYRACEERIMFQFHIRDQQP